jgi:hypothetical protein
LAHYRGAPKKKKGERTMRKAILYLAGASVLALFAFAPATTWAKSDSDWGITVSPGGVHVGPKTDYRDRDRYRYDDRSYDDESSYKYRGRYDDDDDWRYRRYRDRDDY